MSDDAAAARRDQEARRIMEESGAILTGDHFVYVTGEHGDGWIDKDAVFPDTDKVSRLALLAAATWRRPDRNRVRPRDRRTDRDFLAAQRGRSV